MSKHSSRGTVWNALRLKVLERDGHICAYCGNDATTVDHITPKAANGQDILSNLVACCVECNALKGDRPLIRTNYINRKWLSSL